MTHDSLPQQGEGIEAAECDARYVRGGLHDRLGGDPAQMGFFKRTGRRMIMHFVCFGYPAWLVRVIFVVGFPVLYPLYRASDCRLRYL